MSTSACTDRADSQLSSRPCKTGRGVFVRGTGDSVLAHFEGVVREGDGRRLPSSARTVCCWGLWCSSSNVSRDDTVRVGRPPDSIGGSSVICAFSLHAGHMRFLLLHSAHAFVVGLTMRAAR